METAMEEETYNKAIFIIMGILGLIIMIAIIDIITGGTLFRSLVCSMLWYIPGNNLLPAYLNCGSVPL